MKVMCEAKKKPPRQSHPGDLNGAPRGQAERGLGDFSSENIAQEVQNVEGGGNRASAAQLAKYDQNNTCAIILSEVHCSYSPLSKDCVNI